MKRKRTTVVGGLALLAAGGGVAIGGAPAGAQGTPAGGGPGVFGPPFVEPTIKGKPTAEKCIPKENPQFDRELDCKPAAGSLNTLPGNDGGFLYWDALEGTENINANIVAEYGRVAENDQSRKLTLGANDTPSWSNPTPVDAGANPQGDPNTKPIVPGTADEPGNDGALFCADNNFLADGRVVAVGGTQYLQDPGAAQLPFGVIELAGLTATRIYDPQSNTWVQGGRMAQGRWYPTLVTLGDGRMFVASGVEKLIKPVNDSGSSGGNVRETEIFDPNTASWTQNPESGNRSLPLYPRLHLLPDGKVFFNTAGQAFNPFGQDYAEAQWNIASVFDPATKKWTELGVPGLTTGVTSVPGFRGSTTSTMLPLKPDADGRYTKASFLTAGGIPNPPNPGSYLAVAQSQIATVDTADGDKLTTAETGPLTQPRWYGTQTLLPTGEVLSTSGGDRDGVVAPGVEIPVKHAELFDPATQTWRRVAEQNQPRTYHNTAVLMPDGRVLIGGHAPISTLYAKNVTVAPGVTGPNDGRDPSFEIYSPPYLNRGPRPAILAVGGATGSQPVTAAHGESMEIKVDGDAASIESVVLVRQPSITHVVDADQRNVELRVTGRQGDTLTVALPENRNALPAGPYMLFVNRRSAEGLVPSVSRSVFVGATSPRLAGAASRSASPCATAAGFTSAVARGQGRRLRISFGSVAGRPVRVDIFRQSRGRRITDVRVANLGTPKRTVTWNGRSRRGVGDGIYFVRLRTTTPSGRLQVLRLTMQRRNGRWFRRPDFYRRVTCDLLSAFKLYRPVFGGRRARPLRVAYRLARASDVRIALVRGGRVIARRVHDDRPAHRTQRLRFPARRLRRGDYRVRITVIGPDGRRLTSTLAARRL